jgi:hypothetical protein
MLPAHWQDYFHRVREHTAEDASSQTWTTIVNFVLDFACFHQSIDSRYAQHLFESMDDLSVVKDLGTYCTALRMYRKNDFPMAKTLIEHVLRTELGTAAARCAHSPHALADFLEQCVEVFAHGNNWEQITDMHNDLQSSVAMGGGTARRKNDAMLSDVVAAYNIVALIRMGQSREALETLDTLYQQVQASTREEAVEGRMYAIWDKVMSLAGHHVGNEYVDPFTDAARFGIRENVDSLGTILGVHQNARSDFSWEYLEQAKDIFLSSSSGGVTSTARFSTRNYRDSLKKLLHSLISSLPPPSFSLPSK